MMPVWMAGAALFGGLMGVAALASESVARVLARQGRAPWVVALVVSVAWPIVAVTWVQPAPARLATVRVFGESRGVVRAVAAQLPRVSSEASTRTNATLLGAWALASLLMGVRVMRAQWSLARLSRDAREGVLDGERLLITEGFGPAVIGAVRPRVAIPDWLRDLDAPLRRLVLRHERAHCDAHDPMLAWLAEIAVALVPWNPAVWWQARRLRLAIEVDCDQRTLRPGDDVVTYSQLLLLIAQRQQTVRLAPMLAESTTHLSVRITAMQQPRPAHPLRTSLALGAVAVVSLVVACSPAMRDDITRPNTGASASLTMSPSKDGVYFEYQVEQPAQPDTGSRAPIYPAALLGARIEGQVRVQFVVDTMGRADPASFKVLRASDERFVASVREALPEMRFVPAQTGGRKVKQLVQQPFMFSVAK